MVAREGTVVGAALTVAAPLDALDLQLLGLLRVNARTPVVALAQKLGSARATVACRIDRLERQGVIVGYSVLLRPAVETHEVRASIAIAVAGDRTREVIAMLLGDPGVVALHDTNGRWDLLAELRADGLRQLNEVLDRVRLIKGISASETSIHLHTYKLA